MRFTIIKQTDFSIIIAAVYLSLTVLICSITSCSIDTFSIQLRNKNSRIRFSDPILAKRINDKGAEQFPVDSVKTFSVLDSEVVSSIRILNLSGNHTMRWEWYQPDGSLYYSTGNSPLETTRGKYRKETIIRHTLPIHGEKPSYLPGKWTIRIFFDDRPAVSNHFCINDIDVDILPKFSQKADPKKWGMVIGIEKYANLPDVAYACKDAELFGSYLRKIIGVPEENMITITNDEATKGIIEGYLKSYLPSNIDEDATLYLYFAGHGTPDFKDGDAYIVPYDGHPGFIEHTGYRLESLYADVDALKIAKAIIFVDSCFSGAQARGDKMLMNIRPALVYVKDTNMPSEKVIALSASTSRQVSNIYPEKEHGLFSYFLLKGIRGVADTDRNNTITMQELYKYTKTNVDAVSKRIGLEQTPVILPSFDAVENININVVLK